MRTCGVAWGVMGAAGLRPLGPDYLIERFDELLGILTRAA
jgi:hypothetical protein